MSDSGIPSGDGPARDYMVDFAEVISENPGLYLLGEPDALALTSAAAAYSVAYEATTLPATRNELTLIEKDETRNACEALVRQYSMQIKYNSAISTAAKAAIGISQPNPSRSSINVPDTLVLLSIIGSLQGSQTLRFSDSTTPDSRRKPFGAALMELQVAITDEPVTDVNLGRSYGVFTKNPIGVAFNPADNKKTATYWGRWISRKGQVGPWGLPISMTIAA